MALVYGYPYYKIQDPQVFKNNLQHGEEEDMGSIKEDNHTRFFPDRAVYQDRRSGDDRRQVYDLRYLESNDDRRKDVERRFNIERRKDCCRISTWSSMCSASTTARMKR